MTRERNVSIKESHTKSYHEWARKVHELQTDIEEMQKTHRAKQLARLVISSVMTDTAAASGPSAPQAASGPEEEAPEKVDIVALAAPLSLRRSRGRRRRCRVRRGVRGRRARG
jgi:hypothetical protein